MKIRRTELLLALWLTLVLGIGSVIFFQRRDHQLSPTGNAHSASKEPSDRSTDPSHPGENEITEESDPTKRRKPAPRPELPKRPKVEPFPVAKAVPEKEGFVTSPYGGHAVDVRGIPSGTLVADPMFPSEEKRFFRVPPDQDSEP